MKYGLNSIRPLSVLNFVQKSNFLHTFCKKLHFYVFFSSNFSKILHGMEQRQNNPHNKPHNVRENSGANLLQNKIFTGCRAPFTD